MKGQAKILVVDDEPGMRDMLSYELSFRDYAVVTAVNGEDALDKIGKEKFHLVISDVKMPRMDGLEMLEAIKKADPDVEVIMSTGYGTIETAVSAMKMGAYDFVQKPFNIDEILAMIGRALEKRELKALLGVYEAGEAVFATLKLDELLPAMAGLSLRILKADDVSVMLPDPDGTLRVAATAGIEDDLRKDTRLALGERVAGKVARDNHAPVIIDGPLEKDQRFSGIGGLREIRSAIVFPLKIGGRTIGVLNANRTKQGPPFTQADLRYASVFCGQLSQAVHNAKLYHELEAQMREIQRMQSHLVKTEKLAVIGKLAAGVAHEINNPLTGIMGFADLLLANKELQPQQREDLESILQQSQRCRKIVQNLLQFNRRPAGTEPADLGAVLASALQLTRYEFLKSNVEIANELQEGKFFVHGDSSRLEQVFINLISNARQAMEGGKKPLLKVGAALENGRVLIRFEDNGCGIPTADLDKIFDPFFTTKTGGHGTGLGLSISYGIIQEHNGDIKVESKAGTGTVFTVSLPVCPGK